uniref:Uncharacterized protein n=1 Tax=Anguilla anguilla TaxID=7936 RepID=A0A0E9Q9L8_ANGAN
MRRSRRSVTCRTPHDCPLSLQRHQHLPLSSDSSARFLH